MDLKPNDFSIDPRLTADCFILGKLDLSVLLLMNNQLVPWFILVPQTQSKELYELNQNQQTALLKEINLVSDFVRSAYPQVSKLNVAAIGNIVSQMHVHIVGRNPSDYCWPNVVWGNPQKKIYLKSEVAAITQKVRIYLKDDFFLVQK